MSFLEKGKTYQIPLSQIETGFYELRESVGGEKFEELKQSMSEQGQLAPVVVEQYRGDPDPRFKLFIGNRRYQAAKDLGWKTIWVTPIELGDDFSTMAKALVENIQRKDLEPLEEARAVKKMKESIIISGNDLSSDAIAARTQEEIGKALGKSQQFVSESLQIASLKDDDLVALPRGGKWQKKQLLQLVKSRNSVQKKPAGRKPEPFSYRLNGNQLTIRGKIDLEKDDLMAVVVKIEELLGKLKQRL